MLKLIGFHIPEKITEYSQSSQFKSNKMQQVENLGIYKESTIYVFVCKLFSSEKLLLITIMLHVNIYRLKASYWSEFIA